MTIELTPEQQADLAAVAAVSHQTPEEAATSILAFHIRQERESRAMLAKADDDIAAGRVLSHQQVWERLASRFGWE